jgi:hypothetical protein
MPVQFGSAMIVERSNLFGWIFSLTAKQNGVSYKIKAGFDLLSWEIYIARFFIGISLFTLILFRFKKKLPIKYHYLEGRLIGFCFVILTALFLLFYFQ